jgi:hypothetical protein
VALSVAVVAAFYVWTVTGTPGSFEFNTPKQDYYNLLVQGFQRGHLYMNAVPDQALLALPEGARSVHAPFLLDASLYHGHYYLYFGPVPALLLEWPYAALTGKGLPEAAAALVFALAGTGMAILIWLEIRRRLFPGVGAVWTGLAVLAIGLGTAVPSALRHPLFYEVATGAGFTFAMVELWAVLRARSSPSHSGCWLLAAGLACGLATGSRANLAPAGLLLLVLGSWGAARATPAGRRGRRFAAGLAWAALGAAPVGTGLAAYNFERFGNPTEFGHTYQIGVNPERLFHWTNLEHNLGLYYLSPPALNAYFPFVAPRAESPKPPDYVGREEVDGEWIWWPLILMGLGGAGWALWRPWSKRGEEVAWVLGLPAALALVNFLLTASIGARSNRYLMDFQPALAISVLSGAGLIAAGRSRASVWIAGLAGGGCVAVALFNCLASFKVHELFANNDPATYDRVARICDRLVWPWLRFGSLVGDREVTLRWPSVPPVGTLEPLVGAGSPTFDDVIWIEYGADRQARLLYEYGQLASTVGEWFVIRPGETAQMRVSGALLLPKVGHPWYGSRSEAAQRGLKQTLTVVIDGRMRFNRTVPSHDSSPRLQVWGSWRLISGEVRAFSGRMMHIADRAVDERPVLAALAADRGRVNLRLVLPSDRMGETEPIAQFGTAGQFDLVAIRYVRPGVAQLIHDQSAGGADRSPEFAVDYARPHEVSVESPSATDGLDWHDSGPVLRGRILQAIRVTWDGHVVFESTHPPLAMPDPEVVPGCNLVRSSVSRMLFGGELVAGERRTLLGRVTAGSLEFHPREWNPAAGGEGILIRLTSAGGDDANLLWRRTAGEGWQLGWNTADGTVWSKGAALPAMAPLRVRVGADAIEINRADSGPGRDLLVRAPTDLLGDPPVHAEAILAAAWSGGALSPEAQLTGGRPAAVRDAASLPGIVRIRFRLPSHRLVTGAPLLSAGRTAAADSVYLRERPDGRFVLGVDHWMNPATESAPFELSDERVHTAIIELGSIAPSARLGARQVRLTIDGRLVLGCEMALYPVRPGDVVIGANPLGMSTSASTFDGEIVSVRTHLEAGPN